MSPTGVATAYFHVDMTHFHMEKSTIAASVDSTLLNPCHFHVEMTRFHMEMSRRRLT
jgi:hypothetical protein